LKIKLRSGRAKTFRLRIAAPADPLTGTLNFIVSLTSSTLPPDYTISDGHGHTPALPRDTG